MLEKRNTEGRFPEQPPDELVIRTLKRMHARLDENRRKTDAVVDCIKTRWLWGTSLAVVAAVLAVFLIGQSFPKLSSVSFTYQPDMRLSSIVRTDEQGYSSLTALKDSMDQALQPADTVLRRTQYQFRDFAMNENSKQMWFACATYEGEYDVELTVSSFSTTLHNALDDAKPVKINAREVRSGEDEATGDFFAVWQERDYYVQLRMIGNKLTDKEKRACIETLMELPLMKD